MKGRALRFGAASNAPGADIPQLVASLTALAGAPYKAELLAA